MKSVLKNTSLALFSLVALFLIWFGVTYMRAESMLWFHAAAVPERARQDVLPLYRALMTLIGGSSVGVGVFGLYMICSPLRRGARFAGGLLLAVFAGVFLTAAITAERLHAETGAPTSWHIMGVLIAITTSAYIAHAASARRSVGGPDEE